MPMMQGLKPTMGSSSVQVLPVEAGIPTGPSGNGGTGGTGVVGAEVENPVQIHRGVLGDTDNAGEMSDLDATKHRWINPVETKIITMK